MDDSFSVRGAPPPDAALIERFLAGDCTPDEARWVRQWAGSTSDAEWLADVVRGVIQQDSDGVGDSHALYAALRQQLALDAGSVERSADITRRSARSPQVQKRTWRTQALIATTIAVTIAAVAVSRGMMKPESRDVTPASKIYATGMGQKARLTLSDGTRVTLAPYTTLRVVALDARERTVMLEGEAYFDVVASAGAPFVVRSGDVSTRVLGTAFLVRHSREDDRVYVAVRTGKVAVTDHNHRARPVTVAAGHVADVTDSSVTTSIPADLTQYTGWMDGQLVFRNAPAPEVLAVLTRWYGYEFRLADPALARKLLTVAVSTTSSREALSSLKLLLNVELVFAGDTVTLTPRKRMSVPVPAARSREELTDHIREVGR